MPLGPYGGITLDGVQFSTDPVDYEPRKWGKRFTEFETIGGLNQPGSRKTQDFGMVGADALIVLNGGANPLSDDVVIALDTRFRATGQVYAVTDWLGNAYTAFILLFDPLKPLKTGLQRGAGTTMTLYTYVMHLRAQSISKLFGQPYTGS